MLYQTDQGIFYIPLTYAQLPTYSSLAFPPEKVEEFLIADSQRLRTEQDALM
jgi:hypothetical protein